MKKCSKCGQIKSFSHYYKLQSTKDGYRPDCKECHNAMKKRHKGTLEYETKRLAGNILRRINDTDKPKNHCYKDITCDLGCTIPSISNQLIEHFGTEIQEFINQGLKPSVDRIDSTKNYTINNIQITTVEDNVRRGIQNAIQKISKPVQAHFKNGDIKIYNSISEASRDLKIKRDTIYYHLDKDTKTNKGIKFISF